MVVHAHSVTDSMRTFPYGKEGGRERGRERGREEGREEGREGGRVGGRRVGRGREVWRDINYRRRCLCTGVYSTTSDLCNN